MEAAKIKPDTTYSFKADAAGELHASKPRRRILTVAYGAPVPTINRAVKTPFRMV